MTSLAKHPVSRVVRHLAKRNRTTYLVFWAIVLTVWVVIARVMANLPNAAGAEWQPLAVAPPFFLFVVAIVAANVWLPQYVAHGITRRHYGLGSLVFFAATAVTFGLVATIAHALATSAATPHNLLAVFVEMSLLCLAWACAGWLIGCAFYRVRVWLAILLIPVVSLPAMATEVALKGAGHRLEAPPLAMATTVALGAVAVGVLAGFLMVRDVPIKKG